MIKNVFSSSTRIMALLRRLAISLLNQETSTKCSWRQKARTDGNGYQLYASGIGIYTASIA